MNLHQDLPFQGPVVRKGLIKVILALDKIDAFFWLENKQFIFSARYWIKLFTKGFVKGDPKSLPRPFLHRALQLFLLK